ncbi:MULTISPECIES: GNAT family N-acetyltransferase [Salinivibrio]|uniref:GNAT family N-acetyltransferase n=1 Tax=Salinivibrio TaxID=51366 RepID=UPI000984D7C4|nr:MULTISPECIES: GNAT family protein [Salinivibrio]OOF09985.1 hypothetical protein BZG82_09100 [Salinivibrio sp. PR5]OOF10170.1 hypothetical protein BZG83_14250 [Salinivibrio sp. PR919]OOF17606.1 hypothetical protein BZG84_06415 [Salinivibrio sp. PR932]OOF30103.1 hypothetical protein BZJ20_12780 [Salinivibrio proteolyticus]
MLLRPFSPTDLASFLSLSITHEQLPFVGRPEEILAAANEFAHLHLIEVETVIVGGFILDTGYASQYDFAHSGDMGVRAVFIDQHHQGNALGRRAMMALADYVKPRYPWTQRLILTVNCKNAGAIVCYQRAGFTDTGELYHGGSAGPQHIMLKKIDNKVSPDGGVG